MEELRGMGTIIARRFEPGREMRAEFEPTDTQRALVENAVAFGLTQADIAEQLGIDAKTLRKHFRFELSSGKFKVDMAAGKTFIELLKSRDERVRLEAAKYYTARRMGWKEREAILASLSESEAAQLQYDWSFYARPNQLLPAGNWLTWLLLAGRGFG
jgi:hypothetical protein